MSRVARSRARRQRGAAALHALALLAMLAIAVVVATALAPASVVDAVVADRSDGRLRIAEPNGRAWSGEGILVAAGARAGVPIGWDIDPLALVAGELRLTLRRTAVPHGIAGTFVVRGDAVRATGVDAVVPAEALPLPPATLAGGDLRVLAGDLQAGPGRAQGDVRVEWQRARVSVPGIPGLDLGTVTTTLAADGSRWHGPLTARGGALVADGEVRLDADGADLALTLVPQAGAADVRALVGPGDANGAVQLRLTPRFR